jgi:hypothetical protein
LPDQKILRLAPAGRLAELIALTRPDWQARLRSQVWRIAREGRDPRLGAPSRGRWSHGGIDVLYTSLERDGALAEIHAILSMQPVFPSKVSWFEHRLAVRAERTLRLADFPTLARLGVDVARYSERDYARARDIADAAHFLGFDGLLAPNARWPCLNAVMFTERLRPGQIKVVEMGKEPVDWAGWRKGGGEGDAPMAAIGTKAEWQFPCDRGESRLAAGLKWRTLTIRRYRCGGFLDHAVRRSHYSLKGLWRQFASAIMP